ncbi:MAG: choice-of-anchor R domain-containing protein [Minisyncoccota bacterium]
MNNFLIARTKKEYNHGAALILTVLFSLIVSIAIVLGSVSPVVRDLKNAQMLIKSKSSYYTSEAGIEDAFYRIKKGKQFTAPKVLSMNDGTVSVSTVDVSSTEKEIIASGDVAFSGRKVKLTLLTGVGSDFVYGAQVGEGGIVMGSNSKIKGEGGAVGNVFSNGPISGANGSVITGDANVATSLTEDVQARSIVCDTDQNVGKTSPQIDFAQSFVPSSSLPLSRVSLYVKKVGSPSSPSIKIVGDNNGSPKTTSLASGTLLSGNVTTSYGWVDISFSSPTNLVAGNTYWIIIDTSANTNNYFVWCSDSNNGLGNGVGKYKSSWSSSGSWTQITGDLNFKTYLGNGAGTITQMVVNGNAKANTINNSTIGGIAYCQIGSGNNKTCTTSQADLSPLNMPLSDSNIEQWKTDATSGGTITGNCGDSGVTGCKISSGGILYLGPKKITGDLTVSNGGTVKLTGVVYVMGNVSISNNSTVRCDASFGADSCVLVADGWIDANNNALFLGSGQTGSYILAISTIEGCNGGSQTSSCTSGNSGINLGNNLRGAVFYTTKSMINMSNNAEVKAVVGYKINLANNAEVEYEDGVADANFSSGPGGGWNVKSWNEVQ